MNRIPFLLLAVFMCLPFFTVGASAQPQDERADEIVWQRAFFPPVTIPTGDHLNEGFFDQVMLALIDELPEFDHSFQTANFKRILLEMEEGKNICCPSLYKTAEREQYVAFSQPAMIVLPNGLIVNQKSQEKMLPHIDKDGKISLTSLLEDQSITLGISNGRKYAGGLDEILARYSNQSNLVVRSGPDVFMGLMLMMDLGRIDCLLGYPIEAAYQVREGKVGGDFLYYPIKESTVQFTVGYVGCANTSWGKEVIKQVDKVVLKRRHLDFIDYYGQWLDEVTRPAHKKMATEYFKSLEQ